MKARGKEEINKVSKGARRLRKWLIRLLGRLSLEPTKQALFAVARGHTELLASVLADKHDPNNVLSCVWTGRLHSDGFKAQSADM